MNRVLLLEFNELSPVLMDRFIADGHLPAFKRLRDRSATFITEAGESGELLNPWVQWVTVHTGVPAHVHGIRKLGEAHKLTVPTIADVVSAAGGRVWLCGSMNVEPTAQVNGAVLPDPWALDATAEPAALQPFFRFVSANVQEHTSGQQPLSRKELAAFASFMVRHGLSFATVSATVRQLLGERAHRVTRGRRAEILDRFQWDVFRHYYDRLRPHFATFFSNSTAHFQHLHWDELEDDEQRSEVLHGYKQMDRLVDRALALAGPYVTVGLCTALSQTSNRDGEAYDGFYRPCQLDAFPPMVGIDDVRSVAPVMAEQFHLLFDDDAAAARALEQLRAAHVGDEPVFDVRRTGGHAVFVGCRFLTRRPTGDMIELEDGSRIAIDELLYWADAPRQGTHHPDGILWLGSRTSGERDEHDERVPLEAVAPTVLSLLEVDVPASMSSAPASIAR